ncbi:MAG: hypothetical protein WA581_19390 [Candidatus Acidiferrales bacterium]
MVYHFVDKSNIAERFFSCEVYVRRPDAELLKEYVGHIEIVVLARVDDQLLDLGETGERPGTRAPASSG